MARRVRTSAVGLFALALACGGFGSGAFAAQASNLEGVRLADGLQRAESYQRPSTRYVVAHTTPVYRTMTVYGPETGRTVERGQAVEALAEAMEGQWILLGQNGQGTGYVPRSRLCPIEFCKPGAG